MSRILNVLFWVTFPIVLPVYVAFWVVCRLTAAQCPKCGERYMTELIGEWDGEDWRCVRCEHVWVVKNGGSYE